MSEPVSLFDKFYGCIAGVHIGSAMGAPVEGWDYDRIDAQYGILEELLPYEHFHNGWVREAGTTEDGVERQKLMISAIMEKQDRVTAEDVRNMWISGIKPESAGMISEPFEAVLLAMAKSGIPARDIGKYCDYAGLNSFSRSCHPIGLINAGDIPNAIHDVNEVGQLYQTTNGRGLKWATVTAVAIASGTKAGATVDSVLGAIFDHCDPDVVVRELERELKRTAKIKDYREFRHTLYESYNIRGIPYEVSYANEVVTKAVCIFKWAKGNVKEAMVAAVNMGRDTDCVTAVAAGISGALTGTTTIPESWIKQTDYATTLHVVTNSQRTIKEHAEGLYQAYRSRLHRLKAYSELMGAL
ncbi:ADP-ribosylglycohydrolase family protein [Paenibacillus lignilyticus]|uniref:ADP-ribosylglycohydrolase family protein n=1 Tax=Paenibacillus lignilyticus TaxID=1172615 RepID=A0ABS5CDF4_9BACL|nr:ADP-ribosylglycohydrolase family protein [Paenibacillus lignilyticus]MBP3964014.1 ADP-ribosylglycohydrolase family protein [Paenibacillus lignilyticus]